MRCRRNYDLNDEFNSIHKPIYNTSYTAEWLPRFLEYYTKHAHSLYFFNNTFIQNLDCIPTKGPYFKILEIFCT